MKIALYARVSTNGKGQDVQMQLRDLRTYAQSRGMEIVQEYIDEGVSGKKDTRPYLNLLMDDARKRRFDAVLVWRFDRFARSTKHLLTALEEFKHLGIDFISFKENIDTSSPLGKAMFAVTSAIAELEADLIKERVVSGLAHARAKGVRLGRPNKGIDRERLINLRYEQKLPIRAIANQLEVSTALVHKTLSNLKLETLENSAPNF
jgi:DNA invertase Pin-like site-specific DNA recombinase